MGDMDVASSVASDLTTAVTDFSVDAQTTDGATDLKETTWMNNHWTQDLGYYNSIPEVMSVVDIKASWTCGGGIETDPDTRFIIDGIRGINGDSFETILEDQERTKEIGGDSYAEIIRDGDGNPINLKPLDPGIMRHVANKKGILIRFEQVTKVKDKEIVNKLPLNKVFYMPRNRIADEIHGNTMITRLANIILARNEAMADIRQVYHRFVKPRWIIKLDTDDKTKIAAEKTKWDKANEAGENMYIPMGSVEVEQMAISPNSTLNPLTWIENQNTYFYESAQVPRIMVGGSGGFTDAAVKIAYVAFEQVIKKRQKIVEDQVGMQLGLDIKLTMPASLLNDVLSSAAKDGGVQNAIEPNDVTAEVEGKK